MGYDEFTDRICASVPIDQGSGPAPKDQYGRITHSEGIYNTITAINPNTGKTEESAYAGPSPESLALSHDGQTLYVGLRGAPKIEVVDVFSRQIIKEIELGLILIKVTLIMTAPYLRQTTSMSHRATHP